MPVRLGGQHVEGLARGVAGVDHHRQARLAGDADLRREGAALVLGRRVRAVVVQAALADRHHGRVGRQPPDPGLVGRAVAVGVVGVDADRGAHHVVGLRQGDGPLARLEADADRHDALHPRRPGLRQDRARLALAGVEVGVRVDYAATSSTRGKSGPGGRDGRARRGRRPTPPRPAPRRPGPGRARPGCARTEPGMTGQSMIATARRPSARANRVASSSPARSGSFASVQGARSSTSRLRRCTRRQASSAARDRSSFAKSPRSASTVAATSAASSPSAPVSARHDAVAVAPDHAHDAVQQVAQLVGELAGVAGLEALGGERAVLAEADLAHQVVAQRVDPVRPR